MLFLAVDDAKALSGTLMVHRQGACRVTALALDILQYGRYPSIAQSMYAANAIRTAAIDGCWQALE